MYRVFDEEISEPPTVDDVDEPPPKAPKVIPTPRPQNIDATSSESPPPMAPPPPTVDTDAASALKEELAEREEQTLTY